MKVLSAILKFILGFLFSEFLMKLSIKLQIEGPPFLVLVLIIALLAFILTDQKAFAFGAMFCILSLFGMMFLFIQGTKCNAKYFYNKNFETPIKHVKKLKAHGGTWLDVSCSITFKSDKQILLKDVEQYQKAIVDKDTHSVGSQHAFYDLENLENYECLERDAESEHVGSIFCENPQEKDYYFYTWNF